MKTASIPYLAYLFQRYEYNLQLVSHHLFSLDYKAPSVDDFRFARFLAEGASLNGERLKFGDCRGDVDFGSGWGV